MKESYDQPMKTKRTDILTCVFLSLLSNDVASLSTRLLLVVHMMSVTLASSSLDILDISYFW